ncbi:Suppressor of cytokine signaling 2-like Protein [Gryllus bimaculatus]|nr:Suppressor of cytokine signaling 2-like Protein [Gryllus bimaculatus]
MFGTRGGRSRCGDNSPNHKHSVSARARVASTLQLRRSRYATGRRRVPRSLDPPPSHTHAARPRAADTVDSPPAPLPPPPAQRLPAGCGGRVGAVNSVLSWELRRGRVEVGGLSLRGAAGREWVGEGSVMEVLEKPSAHFHLPHALKTESRIWGVCNEEARLESDTAALVPAQEGARRRRERWRRMLIRKLPALLRRFVPPRPAAAPAAAAAAALASTLPLAPAPAPAPPLTLPPPPPPERSVDADARREPPHAPLANSKVTPLETARRWYGAMLTTCPNCLHVFDHPLSSSCCVSSRSAHDPSPPAPHPHHHPLPHHSPPPGAGAPGAGAGPPPPPLLLSATLQLPPSAVPTTCTLAVTASEPPLRALAGMAGGGLVLQQHPLAVDSPKASPAGAGAGASGLAPQPSPSAPLSFVLPAVAGPPRALGSLPLPFQWAVPGPAHAAVHVNVQVPASAPLPQSETDLERLAATMSSLRASGWYYEGLSWQESADLLQATAPGTFLVRDSSDPRFLFSLSVQTERGPTSVRLHYVCGSFRLDAEPRLAPLMPLFHCVVQLVEHYVERTRHRREDKPPRDKEQVWVDARGQMYSHIVLRSPLYKRSQRPSLQHLARLAINKQLRAAGRAPAEGAPQLPLPAPLRAFVGEYPYTA